ncbi:MAG: VanZ family protein [Glycocaulis sp.]
MSELPSEKADGQTRKAGGLPQVAIAVRAAGLLRPWWRILLVAALVGVSVFALWPGDADPPSLFGQHVINHIAAFLVLTMLARAAWPHIRRVWLFLALMAYGALIEALQAIPALQRTASLADLVTDAVGIALGLVLVWIAGQLAGEPW